MARPAEPTAARRISYEDSLHFEKLHETEYTALGFHLIDIPPATPQSRADLIESHLQVCQRQRPV